MPRPMQIARVGAGRGIFCIYAISVKITNDPMKRARTLTERGLDFADAGLVFAGPVFEFEDRRADYGETRLITIGLLSGRMVVIGWTPRGDVHHVFTMRKANGRERERYADRLRQA
jgi:uncharacterized DUF497 family protein